MTVPMPGGETASGSWYVTGPNPADIPLVASKGRFEDPIGNPWELILRHTPARICSLDGSTTLRFADQYVSPALVRTLAQRRVALAYDSDDRQTRAIFHQCGWARYESANAGRALEMVVDCEIPDGETHPFSIYVTGPGPVVGAKR